MNRIDFKIKGPVHLLGNENGDPCDVTPNQAAYRKAFYGMARGFYQATEVDGPIEIVAGAILGDVNILNTTPLHTRMVSIAASRIALRGQLPTGKLEIHYTIDGRDPTVESELYTAPFGISDDTRVRAVIVEDGRPELILSQGFHRTEDPVVSDPRWATDSTNDPSRRNGYNEEGADGDFRRLSNQSKHRP
jgi:hypothetical protein